MLTCVHLPFLQVVRALFVEGRTAKEPSVPTRARAENTDTTRTTWVTHRATNILAEIGSLRSNQHDPPSCTKVRLVKQDDSKDFSGTLDTGRSATIEASLNHVTDRLPKRVFVQAR